MRFPKRFLLGFIASTLLVMLVVEWLGITFSSTELFRSCQGKILLYGSREPYCLLVVRERTVLESNLYMRILSQEMLDTGADYFSEVHYLNDYYDRETERVALEHAEVTWDGEGATFRVPLPERSGDGYDLSTTYRVFIPKESFVGGR